MKCLKLIRLNCPASRGGMAEARPGMKNKEILAKIGQGLLMLIITLLTFKFIMWNNWKLERAATLAEGIIKAPSAVNLTLTQKNTGTILFQKGFPHNPKGNYYIVNQFDITPYIDDNLNITVTVNDQIVQTLSLHRFKNVNAVTFKDYYLFFTTRNCGIEEFIKLKDSIPSIIDSLVKRSTGERAEN